MDTSAHFWARVSKGDGCWEWQGALTSRGYGEIRLAGQLTLTHRLSWTMERGPIPDGLWVLHRCDNRKCVRPDHLFLGDVRANAADAVAKGRHSYGEKNGRAKLNDNDVIDIRTLTAFGARGRDLAETFGVSPQTICDVLKGRGWRHVAGGAI